MLLSTYMPSFKVPLMNPEQISNVLVGFFWLSYFLLSSRSLEIFCKRKKKKKPQCIISQVENCRHALVSRAFVRLQRAWQSTILCERVSGDWEETEGRMTRVHDQSSVWGFLGKWFATCLRWLHSSMNGWKFLPLHRKKNGATIALSNSQQLEKENESFAVFLFALWQDLKSGCLSMISREATQSQRAQSPSWSGSCCIIKNLLLVKQTTSHQSTV